MISGKLIKQNFHISLKSYITRSHWCRCLLQLNNREACLLIFWGRVSPKFFSSLLRLILQVLQVSQTVINGLDKHILLDYRCMLPEKQQGCIGSRPLLLLNSFQRVNIQNTVIFLVNIKLGILFALLKLRNGLFFYLLFGLVNLMLSFWQVLEFGVIGWRLRHRNFFFNDCGMISG